MSGSGWNEALRYEQSENSINFLLFRFCERDSFTWQFLGVWHIVQGTVTGHQVECISLNVTKTDSNQFNSIQMPHNISSLLVVRDESSQLGIQLNETLVADFNVLVTDYGEKVFFCWWSNRRWFYYFTTDNYAGFLICRNDGEKNFFRAAAILSRTKSLSDDDYFLVKKSLFKNGIIEEDLTVIMTCNWNFKLVTAKFKF